MNRLLRLALVLLATGCATFTLTRADALRYAHLSPRAFLRLRFVEAERRVIGEASREVSSLVSGVFGTTDESLAQDRPGLMPDGSVVFRAFFGQINYAQLTRPSIELLRFCNAQGGTFQMVVQPSQNFVADWFDEHGDMGVGSQRRLDAEAGYANALRDKAFGSYQCIHPKHDRPDWSVTIEPQIFEPGPEDNLLIAHELKIHITPAP